MAGSGLSERRRGIYGFAVIVRYLVESVLTLFAYR